MDFLAEYDELSVLKNHTLVAWKFFEIFRMEKEDDTYYMYYIETKSRALSQEEYGAFKAFLKAQRAALRKETLSAVECGKRLWFMFSKILEHRIFDTESRRELLKWLEVGELIMC